MAENEESSSCERIPLLRNRDIRRRFGSNLTVQTSREPREHKRWPCFIWFLLKLIGLYNSRRIVPKRRCHICRLAAAFRRPCSDGENVSSYWSRHLHKDQEKRGSETVYHGPLTVEVDCAVCQTEWFDGEGEYRPYSEEDIGKSEILLRNKNDSNECPTWLSTKKHHSANTMKKNPKNGVDEHNALLRLTSLFDLKM